MEVIFFLFVMGLVWGSFLNVVIYRTSHGKSFVGGRSVCTKCKKVIRWYHNIPLLSFLVLGGKCAYCGKKISWQYPLVELITGLMFVWWYLVGMQFFRLLGSPWQVIQPVFWLVVSIFLLIIFMTDALYGVIPFGVNLGLSLLVIFYRVALTGWGYMNPKDLWWSCVAAIVLVSFFSVLNIITRKVRGVDGIGGGDIVLSPALALLLGWPKILIGIFMAFLIGSVVAIILMIFGKKKMKSKIAFGPFLILGTITALFWGSQIWQWYMGMLQ